MKTGDKLCCKRDFILGRNKWITKGKTYSIFYNEQSDAWYIIDDQKEVNEYLMSDIETYFYTKKELRKMKIEKLNESNLH